MQAKSPGDQADRPRPRRLPLAQHVQIVRVVHDAEHVSERVDDGRGDETRVAARRDRLVLACGRHQTLERRLDVVYVPVRDRAAGGVCVSRRCVLAVDDPEAVTTSTASGPSSGSSSQGGAAKAEAFRAGSPSGSSV
jgi:hypothetical protein